MIERFAGDAERLDLAALHGRSHGRDGVDHHLRVPADDAGAGLAAGPVRHMHDVGAAHGFEQFAGHVIGRALPGRGVIERARLSLGEGEELLGPWPEPTG